MTRTKRFRWLGVPLVALAMVAIPLSAGAARVVPDTYEGNQTCGDFNDKWDELFKVEIGARSGSTAGVSWAIHEGPNGELVDWTSAQPLVAVAVKGGNIGGNLYRYEPNAGSDTGLHTPMNPSEKWADVSHISFCVEERPENGRVEVHKVTEPSTEDTRFGFAMWMPAVEDTWMTNLSHGTSDGVDVAPGAYTIVEAPSEGWILSAVSCEGGEYESTVDGVQVQVEEGETVRCTFVNRMGCDHEHGAVVIEKRTVPVTPDVPFEFVSDIPDDDGTFAPVLSHGQSEGVPVEPGVYSLSEIVPDGWDLTDIRCNDSDVTYTEVGATVEIDEGELVKCIFTNEPRPPEPGAVVIHKVTEPSGSDEIFSFESSIPTDDGFWAPSLTDGQSETIEVEAGTYAVDEVVPDGWDLTEVTCDDDSAVVGSTGVTLSVEEGETVSCTFTNESEPEPGTVVITKVTDPEDTEAWFQFTSSILDGDDGWEPVLGHEESATIEVAAGSYTVAEVEKVGWELVEVSCDDEQSVIVDGRVTLDVDEGETVSCTFTNEPTEEEVPAGIVITKVTDPADTETAFEFESTVPEEAGLWAPTLGHEESAKIEVDPGTYTIDEVIGEGWQIKDIECDDPESVIGDDGVVLSIDASETVSCTFTNEPVPPVLGAIGDLVWNDANANGLQGDTEVGVEGIVVKLFEVDNYAACGTDFTAPACIEKLTDADSTLVDLLMTDQDGLYLFEDVPAGYYFVEFSNLPGDFEFTEPFMGDHELDSDALVASGRTPIMVLAEGERDLDCDAGIFVEKVSPKQVTPTTTTTTEAGATTTTTEPVILPFTGVESAASGIAAIGLVIFGSLLVLAAGAVRRFNN